MRVYEAWHMVDACRVRHVLEDAGIPDFARGVALPGGAGEPPACGLVAVRVADRGWPRAPAMGEPQPLSAGGGDADSAPLDGAMPA
jgi:hypothetical protein